MASSNPYFNQSILYRGINITCKSSFGYRYRVKKGSDPSLSSLEFIKDFVSQLNTQIKSQVNQLLIIDLLAVICEVPLIIVLLVFSSTAKDNQTLLITLTVVIIVSSLIFIYFKISGVVTLQQRIQEFLDQKKGNLSQRRLRAIMIKSRCNDRAPEVFLNLLPEKLLVGQDLTYVQDENENQEIANKENGPEYDKLPLNKKVNPQNIDEQEIDIKFLENEQANKKGQSNGFKKD